MRSCLPVICQDFCKFYGGLQFYSIVDEVQIVLGADLGGSSKCFSPDFTDTTVKRYFDLNKLVMFPLMLELN